MVERPSPQAVRLGCVSYLNARPLIEGLDAHSQLHVRYDVPSRLLEDLLGGEVDVALCPVVDYQCSPTPLQIVPVGGIGCDGPTLTVRLFSRVPFAQVRQLYADPDSHTSVVLAQLILCDMFGTSPQVLPLAGQAPLPASVLLIGDKVVREAPSESQFPHQLDLGRAWKELTGLPFVFAIWMCRVGAELGRAPQILDHQRVLNAQSIEAIARRHACPAGFPPDVATTYLGQLLRYTTGPRELQAVERFWTRSKDLGLLPRIRPLSTYSPVAHSSV